MASKMTLVDETVITIEDAFSQVDDTYEYTGYCANYDELKEIASKLTDENLKKVIVSDMMGNEITYTNMTCSSPKMYIVSDNQNIKYVIRIKAKTDEDKAKEAMTEAIQKFDDEEAKSVKVLYPEFDTLIGKSVGKDFKLVYYNVLYKTAQAITISADNKPGGVGMESLYTRIDETHAGTGEDPIPYYGNQILEKGKIYVDEEGTLWICTNGSGIAVFDQPIYLAAFAAQWSDAEGTSSDPIIYAGGLELFEGKYYIQNGVIYKCIRNSETPIYTDLSGLVGNYVEIYNPYEIPTEPDEGDGEDEEEKPAEEGTLENPIPFDNVAGTIIYNGKYYIQDGVIYKCTRDSIIALYNPLKDLVNIYVEVVEE